MTQLASAKPNQEVKVRDSQSTFEQATLPSVDRGDLLLEAARKNPVTNLRKPELVAQVERAATFEDLRTLGAELNARLVSKQIGGRGWTGNIGTDEHHCGEVANKAADELRAMIKEKGYTNVQVGVVLSQKTTDGPIGFIMNNMTHAVTALYIPGQTKAVIVDAWDSPRRVLESPATVTSTAKLSTSIEVNFPQGDGSFRQHGYGGTLSK